MQPQAPNPYQPPTAQTSPSAVRTPEGWVPCPSCGGVSATMPSFTWWGGVIGAKMLTHVVCDNCRTAYNGKTGKSNTTGIVIYSVVIGVIAIGLMTMINSL